MPKYQNKKVKWRQSLFWLLTSGIVTVVEGFLKEFLKEFETAPNEPVQYR